MKKIILGLLFLGIIFSSNLQAQLEVSAEMRPRVEANHGYKTLPVESSETAFFVSQRSRVNIKYKSEKFTTYFSLQDVRLWGQEDVANKTGIQASSIGVDVAQAWFNWSFSKNWGLKTGRQVWNYDDGRFLSGRNWNQNGLSYDAFLLQFNKSDFHFHFGSSINNTWASFNKEDFNPEENPYESPLGYRIKYLNFVWLKFHVNEAFTISIADYFSSYLAKNTKSTIYSLSTSGIYLNYKTKKLIAEANAFYQFGKNAKGQDQDAYMFTLSAKYKIKKWQVGAGLDYLSGDEPNSQEKKSKAFDLLYGARFKYYGWMNYYLTTASTKNGGLIDIYPDIKWSINKKHSLFATYHFFSLAQKAYDLPVGGDVSYLNSDLGGELNVNYTYKYSKEFNIRLFVAYYNASETLEFIKGVGKGNSTSPYMATLMLTFKPQIFGPKTKTKTLQFN